MTKQLQHYGLFRLLSAVLSAAALAGCASEDAASSFFVAPGHYVLYQCDDIDRAAKGVVARQKELELLMAKAGTSAGGQLITVIRLTGGDFSVCHVSSAHLPDLAKKRKRRIRFVWGDGKGSFRTSGNYSSATVQGTKWLTADRCDGTYTQVAHGRVLVRDFRRHKTILLHTGQSYLAKAP